LKKGVERPAAESLGAALQHVADSQKRLLWESLLSGAYDAKEAIVGLSSAAAIATATQDAFDAIRGLEPEQLSGLNTIAGTAIVTHIDVGDTLAAIDELLPRVDLAGQIRALKSSYIDTMTPAMTAALSVFQRQAERTRAFARSIEASAEQASRYERALLELDWVFPPSMAMTDFWRVGRLASEASRTRVRHEMLSLTTVREMRDAVQAWMRFPELRDRRPIVFDGYLDHRQHRYRVSIPTLLPVIEGALAQRFFPLESRGGHFAARVRSHASGFFNGPDLVSVISALWTEIDFATMNPRAHRLNRHAVMHGRSTRYGRAENSAKVVITLDLVAAVLEADAELRRAA
jgi:hypothetical protein